MFTAIANSHPSPLTYVFLVGAFIGILKTSPAPDVVDEDDLELSSSRFYFQQKLAQTGPTGKPQTVVHERFYYQKVVQIGIFVDCVPA